MGYMTDVEGRLETANGLVQELAAEVLRLRAMVEWLVIEVKTHRGLHCDQSPDFTKIMTHPEWEIWQERAITWRTDE